MRTTVTLDKDVEQMLREAVRASRRPFKETLNTALRVGLTVRPGQRKCAPFAVSARPMGLRAGLDPTGFNKLADELEADACLEMARRGRKR